MIKLGILGCGFLGKIVAHAWKDGFLPDYDLIGITGRNAVAVKETAQFVGCTAFSNLHALLETHPDILVETASVEAVREAAEPALFAGCDLILISAGALADESFRVKLEQTAKECNRKIYIPSGAVGGFDVLETMKLMAKAGGGEEHASFCTHTGASGFINTPVWRETLKEESATVFTGTAEEAIALLPQRVNVAVASALMTTGPERMLVDIVSVPEEMGDNHRIMAEIEEVRATIEIQSRTSAIAGWSIVALLRKLISPICFY